MRKIISVLLVLTLVLSVSGPALAADSKAAPSGTCGEAATWSFADGTLRISGTGEVQSGIRAPWQEYQAKIEHLVVEEGITGLGSCCFIELYNLKSVKLPDSLRTIENQVFQSCDQLTQITIPKNVERIGSSITASSAFSGSSLKAIHVAPENERYYSHEGVLIDRHSSTLLCCPMGKTGDVYTVPGDIRYIASGAFWFSTLKSIVLPEGLLEIEDSAFFGAHFSAIEIPSTVTAIGSGAFENCDQLTHITVPENVRMIERHTFASCEMLEKITIMNPACVIANDSNTITEAAVLCGNLDSTAQAYAIRYGREFEDLKTAERYNYNLGNAGYIALLPLETGGTAPSFNHISTYNNQTGQITGYQPNIVLERDRTNATYQEMLTFVKDLTQNCAGDYEKAQKISAWVTENMTYVFGYMGQGTTAEGVYSIWKNRVGNCEGYTQLTNFMLHLAGIPTATVTSYAHTWTAALIGGKWIMIDSTNAIFDAPVDTLENITRICFAVNDNLVCVIDDLTGVKLASYGLSVMAHAGITEITIPSYVTDIYHTIFHMEGYYGEVTTQLTIKGTVGSYAETYMKEHMPHYNDYTYEKDQFIAKVGRKLTEDDAIYLLRHVLFPELYPYENAPDYTKDGRVTEDDAIYLLRHVLFPELYPL